MPKPARHSACPSSTHGQRSARASESSAAHTPSAAAKTYGGTLSSWLDAALKPKELMIELGRVRGEGGSKGGEGVREEERDAVD